MPTILIAIGAGPAGESATELASFFGHRSAIVEKNRPGGVVTTTGGAPTKTLREAALYFSGFAKATSMACGCHHLPRSPRCHSQTHMERMRAVAKVDSG
jgi:pyruvate/2-oxoglutarate dehydrogenase complex dihydrolipoamide dehydrogenase (E3) component